MNKAKKCKKIIGISVAAILALSLAGCGGNTSKKEAAGGQTAKIGLMDALTGNAAVYGKSVQEGVQLAVDEINNNPDNKIKIEVVTEDTGGEKGQAMNAMNKLVHKDNVLAIIGPLLSGEAFASGPVAQQAGVTMIGATLTADGITNIGDVIFRTCLPESMAIPAAVKRAHTVYGFKTVAILYSNNNDQLVSGYKSFQKSLDEIGVQTLTVQTFADKDTDFSAQLTKIAATKPDILVVASHYKEGSLILKKAREMGMNMPVIGSNGFNSPALVDGAGVASNNVIVGSPWFPNKPDDKVQSFRKAYVAKYNHEPDQFSAQGYDAVYMVYHTLQTTGNTTDRKVFKKAFGEMKDFVGVAGNVKFDANREPIMDVNVLIIRDGNFEAL